VLLEIDWPSRKHNGGGLAFGADGLLYVGLGDGGGVHGVGPDILFEAFDVPASLSHWDWLAQDTSALFGKILRIDAGRGYPGYAIPPLNPLVGADGRDEIYAWGFRNPYRFSFDGNALFVTAVGETLWESVYLVDKPGNYGWPIREATHCFDRHRPETPPLTCPERGSSGEPFYRSDHRVFEHERRP
jgi:glucose/arabinose dehydrogenase